MTAHANCYHESSRKMRALCRKVNNDPGRYACVLCYELNAEIVIPAYRLADGRKVCNCHLDIVAEEDPAAIEDYIVL